MPMRPRKPGLCIAVAVVLSYAAMHVVAQDDGDADLKAQLQRFQEQCRSLQASAKLKEQKLEEEAAAASVPPEKRQEVAEKIQQLKAAVARTDELLARPPPATKEAREAYLGRALNEIAATRELESTLSRDLGTDPASRLEAVLAGLGQAEDFKTKFGAFDRQDHAYDPDLNAAVVLGSATNFFGIDLPPSVIPPAKVQSAYSTPTVAEAKKNQDEFGSSGGGVLLAGQAQGPGLESISRVDYDGGVNALVLNDNLVYFVKIPPWSLATLCRQIGTDRRGLLGVSETQTEGLVFGDKPELYKNSDIVHDLMLADRFLGDVVFAHHAGWIQGYKFPGDQPRSAVVTSNMLVQFEFRDFEFDVRNDVLYPVRSSLQVRMMPVSGVASPSGQMLPNYVALEKGWAPPAAFIANAQLLTGEEKAKYFRREPIIGFVYSYGETAAILRSLKKSGHDLNALADRIETGGPAT